MVCSDAVDVGGNGGYRDSTLWGAVVDVIEMRDTETPQCRVLQWMWVELGDTTLWGAAVFP